MQGNGSSACFSLRTGNGTPSMQIDRAKDVVSAIAARIAPRRK